MTQAQWTSVMPNNPSCFKGDLNRPVENVSLADCQDFLAKIQVTVANQFQGFKARFPTLKQWKYACLAGSNGELGNDDRTGQTGKIDVMAWYNGNSNPSPLDEAGKNESNPVGRKHKNSFGFFDMHGNVCELCMCDDVGGKLYRYCGGSFNSTAEECSALRCRLAEKGDLNGRNEIGLRVALVQDDEILK